MTISINKIDAKISIERIPSKLSIETKPAKLEFKQNHVQIKIESTLPKVEISQYECFAEEGLKNNRDFSNKNAQLGYEQAMSYIAKCAEDGDALAAIEEKGGNPIVDIAKRDTILEAEYIYDYLPKSRPYIGLKPGTGTLKIDFGNTGEGIHNGVEIDCIPNEININYTPAKVTTRLSQYPSIQFKYEGKNFDKSV